MKLYIVEYTEWTQGDKHFEYPFRTYKVTNDKMRALGFMKDRMTEKHELSGYVVPKFFDMEGVEVDCYDAIKELEIFESTINFGEFI